MPHPAKIPQTKQVPLVSPIGGVVQSVAREQQPMGGQGPQGAEPPTCWDALNVLPYDIYGRERVAERFGITKKYAGSLGLTQIQGMQAANFIVPTGVNQGSTGNLQQLISNNWGETNTWTTTKSPTLATGISGFTGTVLSFNTAGTLQNVTVGPIGFNSPGTLSVFSVSFEIQFNADTTGNGASGAVFIPTPWNTSSIPAYAPMTLTLQSTSNPALRSVNLNGNPVLSGQNWQGTPFLFSLAFGTNGGVDVWNFDVRPLNSGKPFSGPGPLVAIGNSSTNVIPEIAIFGEVSAGQTAPIFIQ